VSERNFSPTSMDAGSLLCGDPGTVEGGQIETGGVAAFVAKLTPVALALFMVTVWFRGVCIYLGACVYSPCVWALRCSCR
jgi:hypothetical protein